MDDLFGVTELAKNMDVEEAERAGMSEAGVVGEKPTTAGETAMELGEREKATEIREDNLSIGVGRTGAQNTA